MNDINHYATKEETIKNDKEMDEKYGFHIHNVPLGGGYIDCHTHGLAKYIGIELKMICKEDSIMEEAGELFKYADTFKDLGIIFVMNKLSSRIFEYIDYPVRVVRDNMEEHEDTKVLSIIKYYPLV